MKIFLTIIFLLLICPFSGQAQFKNNVWCFGDSAGIRFNQGATQIFTSSTLTRGGSCSISDSTGDLLFYANTDYFPLWTQGNLKLGVVYDKFNNLMQNGDTLIGGLNFQEQVIVPVPISSNLFYLFSTGIALPFGFYYSLIDIMQNGNLGSVILKNVQLANYQASDCVSAVKHGNGRDWWVIFRRWDTWNDEYYIYLITPFGISGPFVQHIGTFTNNGFMHSTFSRDGSKYLVVDYRGLVEVYDFDRCTGQFTNVITIEPEPAPGFYKYYTGCAFSPNQQFIYVNSTDQPITYLYQFDLLAPNIAASKTLISSVQDPSYFGYIRLAPDNKIYCSLIYQTGNIPYPYPDSVSNQYNENLSVINYPDSAGAACGFSPFSFYLGGNETYWGLPNNPDYDLGPIIGSGCDTLTSLPPTTYYPPPSTLQITWASGWHKAFINAQNLKGRKWTLEVFDLYGNRVYFDRGNLIPPYFSRGIELPGIAAGMYVTRLSTEREVLSGKFIVD